MFDSNLRTEIWGSPLSTLQGSSFSSQLEMVSGLESCYSQGQGLPRHIFA